ncbi:STAS domain-containing protein [Spongiactinospora sp. TRM90649]|uniref:STAS domain-containing protein n=1 Tax=Spongiactinospora sp. TRM90649 TaxID=3031114 RepID=UPI0023F8E32E|nr:STAS domain-containing protein [Spongiactinospora sp. TRM90649]MDF5757059.1 STAS domain-containing protein [Spongiactinospora sp. TRM90649]
MGFAVDTSWIDGCAVVAVTGEVDLGAEAFLRARLQEAFAGTRSGGGTGAGVVLDLSETTFMDARGISVLVAARAMAAESRIPLRVVGIRPRIRSMLGLVGLDTAFCALPETRGLPAAREVQTPG